MDSGGALRLLPAEIWEMCMGLLEDSRDILNVYKAFPELEHERVFKHKTCLWLFEQVFPHIFPYLSKGEALECRQVCRQWCRGVDQSFENHPAVRAYDYDHKQIVGQHWSRQASLGQHNYYYFQGWLMKAGVKTFPQFLAQSEGHHSSWRNPVVGRQVVVFYPSMYDPAEVKQFQKDGVEFFRRFGGHIWSLFIFWRGDSKQLPFYRFCLDILKHVPNVRRFKLEPPEPQGGTLRKARKMFEDRAESLPVLSQLESLEWGFVRSSEPLVNFLMTRYSTQVRRLVTPHAIAIADCPQLFPNLVELDLQTVESKREMLNLLLTLDCPKLRTLVMGTRLSLLSHENVVEILSKFPVLHSLSARFVKRKSKAASEAIAALPSGRFPSLQSLQIEFIGKDLDLTVLKLFPSLSFMKILWETGMVVKQLCEKEIYELDVWETHPRLEHIGIKLCNNWYSPEGWRPFSRAGHEYMQRKALAKWHRKRESQNRKLVQHKSPYFT